MTLHRKLLRDAAKTALEAIPGLSVTGHRAFARNVGGLPAAEVMTPSEEVERIDDDGDLRRTVVLFVALHAADADVEDVLDALAEQVEAALFGSAALAELAAAPGHAFSAAGTEFVPGDRGDAAPARLAMTFVAEFLETR